LTVICDNDNDEEFRLSDEKGALQLCSDSIPCIGIAGGENSRPRNLVLGGEVPIDTGRIPVGGAAFCRNPIGVGYGY